MSDPGRLWRSYVPGTVLVRYGWTCVRDAVIVVGSTDDSPLLDTVDWNGHPISYLGRTMGEYVAVREWNYDDD